MNEIYRDSWPFSETGMNSTKKRRSYSTHAPVGTGHSGEKKELASRTMGIMMRLYLNVCSKSDLVMPMFQIGGKVNSCD